MNNEFDYVRENAKRILYNVNEAMTKYGNSNVSIMAVTKTVPPEAVNVAVNSGIALLGENRVQEFLSKHDFYDRSASVDFIGHLQSNKVKYIINDVRMIHSVDSIKLADDINRLAEKNNKIMNICVEVNIGREISKSGVFPEELEEMMYKLAEMPNIKVCGLMSIPPKEETEKFFSKMHELFIDISGKNIDNINVSVLSMGMSADYKEAIKHGSTLVRIGTDLFGSRK